MAWNARKELQKVDKDSEDPSFVLHSSFGSKIDFVRLVKTLTSDNNVEVLSYNSDLANFVTSSLEPQDIKLQFISDLETIARRTGNLSLEKSVEEAKRKIEELSRQKKRRRERLLKQNFVRERPKKRLLKLKKCDVKLKLGQNQKRKKDVLRNSLDYVQKMKKLKQIMLDL